jgi:O-antigen/teichoic acid export membrane protein
MIVGEFGAVQVGVQAIGAIAGFIIIRSLAKPEYALYALANSGLAMFNILAGTGLAPALRSIGGEVHDDRTQFSQLVATVCQLRKFFALFALSISIPVTAWMLWSNGATALQTFLLCTVVCISCWPLLTATVLREAALMLGRYRKVQFVDFSTSAVRLTCIVAAFAWLNALLGVIVAGLANWIQWYIYRRRSPEDVEPASRPSDVYRGRALGITKQVLPNTLFYCFQGQITFVLLTLFGTSTGLADVAALGRIAALLAIFGTVFSNVLAPRFARCQDAQRLPRLYFGLVGLTVLLLTPVVAFSWFFPHVWLWILGSAYSGLERECVLIVIATSLHQLGGVMASLNFCRNWIRWYCYLNIPAIIATQIACIVVLDLSTVRGVLMLSIASALAPIPVYLVDTWRGFRGTAETRPEDQLRASCDVPY